MTKDLTSRFQYEDFRVLARGAAFLLVGSLGVYSAPYQIEAFVSGVGMRPMQASWLVSINVFGTAIGSLTASAVLARGPSQLSTAFGFLLLLLGQAISMFSFSFHVHVFARGLTGFASGLVLASGNAILLSSTSPEASFGKANALMSVVLAVFLGLVPRSVPITNLFTLFGLSAAISLVCLPLCYGLPRTARELPDNDVRVRGDRAAVAMLLIAVTAYYLACGGAYVLSGQSASRVGVSLETYETLLGIFPLAGIAGATAAGVLGLRAGRLIPLSLGAIVSAMALTLIVGSPLSAGFTVGLLAYGFVYPFTATYLMGLAGTLDPSTRLVVAMGGYLLIPYSLGPALAGAALGLHGWQSVQILIGVLAMIAAVTAVVASLRVRTIALQQ